MLDRTTNKKENHIFRINTKPPNIIGLDPMAKNRSFSASSCSWCTMITNEKLLTYVEESSDNLSALKIIGLHLVPGLLITLAFIGIASLFARWNLPPSFALMIAMLTVALPFELGYLFFLGYRKNARLSLKGVVIYNQSLIPRQWLVWGPVLFVWAAAASTLAFPFEEIVRTSGFTWWPEILNISALTENLNSYADSVLWMVGWTSVALNLTIPVVEELYFRGYLLPRMARWGWFAPLANTILFSIYHFWAPWQIISRIVALLPTMVAVYYFKSVRLGIIIHVVLNITGSIGLLVLIGSRL